MCVDSQTDKDKNCSAIVVIIDLLVVGRPLGDHEYH